MVGTGRLASSGFLSAKFVSPTRAGTSAPRSVVVVLVRLGRVRGFGGGDVAGTGSVPPRPPGSMRSRMPLTNCGEFALPNFLASSIASSMATRGGVSLCDNSNTPIRRALRSVGAMRRRDQFRATSSIRASISSRRATTPVYSDQQNRARSSSSSRPWTICRTSSWGHPDSGRADTTSARRLHGRNCDETWNSNNTIKTDRTNLPKSQAPGPRKQENGNHRGHGVTQSKTRILLLCATRCPLW